MKAYDPSEFVSLEDARKLLKSTLVICPVYSQPAVPTAMLIDLLRELGAKIQITRGISDIATARNLAASRAFKEMPNFDTVFWLDGDMTASPMHVAALVSLALEHDAAMAGFCCQRADNRRWAAKRLAIEHTLPALDRTPREGQTPISLIPVYAGMACLAVPKRQFLAVCNAAPWFTLKGSERAPAICQSRMLNTDDWGSEDIWHSILLWNHGGLYLAPIAFGHLTEVAALPAADGWFLDEEPRT